MKPLFQVLSLILLLTACSEKESVDLMLTNANIYTVNDNFDKAEAIAVKNGKIVAVGTSTDLDALYIPKKTINAEGRTVLPGLIDAHCHFYGLGLSQQKVDLSGTISFEEVLDRIVAFQKENNLSYITGRGWDQNDWEIKEFPNKTRLDELFPDTPVAIRRVDGHALLANQAAIDLAKVTTSTPFSGGEILQKDGKLTGIFIDAPMSLIIPPAPSKKESIAALLGAQKTCFELGLTTVNDAGLGQAAIELIDSLQQAGSLKMRVYAMISGTQKKPRLLSK